MKMPYTLRHLLFLVLTLFISCLMGYYFGTFDQVSHIAFLKKNADPSLFPADRYFDLRLKHFSFFWLFFIPFYKLGILEEAMFVIHLISIYLTFWAVWNISYTLFENNLASLLSVVASAFPHFGFSGFPLIEFSLLNRTFVFPFLLLSINLYLQKKYVFAYVLLGLLYNLHVVSVNFVLAMFVLDYLYNIRHYGLNHIKYFGIFIFFSLPVLMWKFGQSHIDLAAHTEWFHIISSSFLYHLFHFLSFNNIFVIPLTIGGVVAVYLFFHFNVFSEDKHKTIRHFIIACLFILAIGGIISHIYPITIIIQSQVMRAGIFIVFFATIYASYEIVSLFEKKKITLLQFISLSLSCILSFSPFMFLILYEVGKRTKKIVSNYALIIIVFLTYGAFLYFTAQLNFWKPGIHIQPQNNEYNNVQIWAKTHTLKTDIFIVPPYKWWLYGTEWRALSERVPVVTLSELLEAAFDPSYITYWKPRFEDVAPGALARFDGNPITSMNLTKSAYTSITQEKMILLARKYNASYVVVEKPHSYSFRKAYENKEYTVYDLRLLMK